MSSLDNLRKAAKRWLRELRAGDAAARARLQRAYRAAPSTVTLRDVQRALALERGYDSWAALKSAVTARAATEDPESPETALTALLEAAGKGQEARVAHILDRYPEIINRRGLLDGNSGQRSALHYAVAHEPVVRLLLQRGADPNIRDEGDNAMPLHFAAENQDLTIMRLLIEHGADPVGEGDTHELEVIGWACCWDYRDAN